MNICIPVTEDKGLRSPVYAHFGSAPIFMIVETEGGSCRAIRNHNQHHGHGMCKPLASIQGERIDGMVVGGIGMGAVNRLLAAGIQVLLSHEPTVEETLTALKAGTLQTVTPETACGQHRGGHHMYGRQ